MSAATVERAARGFGEEPLGSSWSWLELETALPANVLPTETRGSKEPIREQKARPEDTAANARLLWHTLLCFGLTEESGSASSPALDPEALIHSAVDALRAELVELRETHPLF